ncbi:alpha/beta hydrolase family protein [Oerskovia flava]|uniref:alpha/beta hydrolase family protein n=1 Tax=Oerskovia flava TaxID=2986422 RepID=UPI00223EEF5E|nr:alpha/beta fold hydrolase [Oerskovia sp. JB1-3-2]
MSPSSRRAPRLRPRPRSSPRLHVVFVPGLGDRWRPLVWLQRQALRGWRAHGVCTTLFPVGWSSEARLDDRLEALDALIDTIEARGEQVVLVGASAGAGAVLAAYARRPEVRAVTIVAAKYHDPAAIPGPVLEHNDLFDESLRTVPTLLERLGPAERARILALRSAKDGVVPDEDTLLAGAVNETMRIVGHVTAIGYALLFRSRRIVRFAREAPGPEGPARSGVART